MSAIKQRITPFLWFNDNAEEAVDYYVGIFKNSKVGKVTRYTKESAQASGRHFPTTSRASWSRRMDA